MTAILQKLEEISFPCHSSMKRTLQWMKKETTEEGKDDDEPKIEEVDENTGKVKEVSYEWGGGS